MKKTTTVPVESGSTSSQTLLMAMELSEKSWVLGFTIGLGQKARRRTVKARDVEVIGREIALAKKRFKLAADAPVVSCYEAGRDGFWLHRALGARLGVDNRVIDSASIEVKRGRKHAKSDGLDVESMLRLLARHVAGERKVFGVVNVPSAEIEDMRQLHRDLLTLKTEQTALRNRVRSLLITQGCVLRKWRKRTVKEEIESLRGWDGQPLGEEMQVRIGRELERLDLVEEQIAGIVKTQQERLAGPIGEDSPLRVVSKLMRLRAVGMHSAWVVALEALAWRQFRNRKQVGGCFGLTPTPFQSGGTDHDQGISKAGSVWVRRLAVEMAWLWVRWQPQSELSQWFERTYAKGGKRQRRLGIVALARKLMVALWRYVDHDEVPAGAIVRDPLRALVEEVMGDSESVAGGRGRLRVVEAA